MPTPCPRILAVALPLVLLGVAACASRPDPVPETPLREDGTACGPEGNASCRSGHCDGGLCCSGGACCLEPSDCPPAFHSPSACGVIGPATDCQGERRDATCQSFVCGAVTVVDDSGCSGLARSCGTFDPVLCTALADQPLASCPTTCTGDGQCLGGHACVVGSCVAVTGLGTACTGAGQGSCASGLKCENGTCCDAAGSACCASSSQCAAGLACDPITFSCFTSCADYDVSRCASPGAYCLGNACLPKLAPGEACARPEACSSGACECFDASCATRRCRSTWCGVCEVAASDSACGTGLGAPAPVADPRPGECEGAVACYAGACRKNDGVGCGANVECGNACINGVCAPFSGVGGPCDERIDCGAGLVCCGFAGPPLLCQTPAVCRR